MKATLPMQANFSVMNGYKGNYSKLRRIINRYHRRETRMLSLGEPGA